MEFLFENPFLIFILIAFLSSLFKKGKEEQKQPPKKTVRPIQQNDDHSGPMSPSPSRPMMAETLERDKPFSEQEQDASENPFLEFQQKFQEKIKEIEQEEPKQNIPVASHPSIQTKAVKRDPIEKTSIDLTPDADRVIEGIAWAQVLGPPRARNPYHKDRRR